jgi:esterase
MLTTYETSPEGPETAPPLLIAHGLFGSSRNWGAMAKRLAVGRRVVSVDMRNHGSSPWLPAHGYPDLAADLADVISSLGGHADVLGHSMGGKAAMALALIHPEHVRRLVVGDIAPVSYSHSQSDLVAAMRNVDLTHVTRRSEADKLLAKNVGDAGVRAFLLQSLDVEARRWRLNLDVLDAEMPRIIGWARDRRQIGQPGAVSDRGVVQVCLARARRGNPFPVSRSPDQFGRGGRSLDARRSPRRGGISGPVIP